MILDKLFDSYEDLPTTQLVVSCLGKAIWNYNWKQSSNKKRAKLHRYWDKYSNVRRLKRELELARRNADRI